MASIRSVAAVSFLTLVAAGLPEARAGRSETEAERVRQDMKRVIDGLARAMSTRDVMSVARLVAPEGLQCEDDLVPRDVVAAELRTPGTWLHSYFFDTAALQARYADRGVPMSLADFFSYAHGVSFEIGFTQYPGRPKHDRPCIRLQAKNLDYTPFLCFARSGGHWYFAQGPECD